MNDCEGPTNDALKESKVFSINSASKVTQSPMKSVKDDFVPGDLVFAKFSGYSWPAIVASAKASTINIVTLVLEQDEVIDKEDAVHYGGSEHLQQIMSLLTPGERQDFSEASSSLIELSAKSRSERLHLMSIDAPQEESGKENDSTVVSDSAIPIPTPSIASPLNKSPLNKSALSKSHLTKSPEANPVKEDFSSGGIAKSQKNQASASHPVKEIIVKSDQTPRFTLEIGSPNFCSLDIPLAAIDDMVQHPTLSIMNECSKAASKMTPTKEERDEAYINNAVALTNRILHNPFESSPGQELSYDGVKMARERALLMVDPNRNKRERSRSNSFNLFASKSPDEKAHVDHLKAVRASQKKSLKSLAVPLEIVQTTARNPSKKPGRKSVAQKEKEFSDAAVISQICAEEAFHEAATLLMSESSNSVNTIEGLACVAAEKLLNVKSPAKSIPNQSPAKCTSSEDLYHTKLINSLQREVSAVNSKSSPKKAHQLKRTGKRPKTKMTKTKETTAGKSIENAAVNGVHMSDRKEGESESSESGKDSLLESNKKSSIQSENSVENSGTLGVEIPLEESKLLPLEPMSLQLGEEGPSSSKGLHSLEEPISVDNSIINFLMPYYISLFENVIKEQLLKQIKADLQQLNHEEMEIIYKMAEGSSAVQKPAVDVIAKLIRASRSGPSNIMPEVGPGTPPASPKSQATASDNAPHAQKSGSSDSSNDTELDERKPLRRSCKALAGTSKSGSKKSKKPKSPVKISTKSWSPRKHAMALYIRDLQIGMPDATKLKQSEVKFGSLQPECKESYMLLGEKMAAMSDEDYLLENRALSLYVKSTSGASRTGWLSLNVTKKRRFIREAKKLKKDEVSPKKVEAFNEDLLSKVLNSESRKRKRESQSEDEDSEPNNKKEKGDGTILDFFCLDCFNLDYNTKIYTACSGCNGLYHTKCLEKQSQCSSNTKSKQRTLCSECHGGPVCPICRKGGNLKNCAHCSFKYHIDCVMPHMSTQELSPTSFICPYHVCGSCEARPELSIKNFVRCVRCPQSFHENHLPAGCMRISKRHILCFRHHKGFGTKAATTDPPKKPKKSVNSKKRKTPESVPHVNVSFCFQCTFGGDLICCEGCPASFHNDCVPEENRLKEGESSWLCPDCIVGKKPFVGDIVWVKFGQYRWWPCQLVDEIDLPDNIFSKPHKPCQFPAICLGTNEFSWLDMSRVYSYEDGDKGGGYSSSVSKSFKLALIEAKDLHGQVKQIKETLLQEISALEKPSTKKPAPFKFIKANMPYNSAMREYEKQLKLERAPFPCDCTGTDKCSADSNCINRVLLTECPPSCKWGGECENRRFQRKQYPATKLVKTNGRGWGLIASEDITTGSLVHEYVGEIIDEVEVQRRLNDYQRSGITDYYMLTVENSRIIDAKPKANNARFMNHSCDPNCETQKWNVCGLTCIGLFAKRDISKGEELTFDYQFDTRGQQKKACLCGSTNCSGFLGVPAKKIVEVKEPSKKKIKRAKKTTRKQKKSEQPDGNKKKPAKKSAKQVVKSPEEEEIGVGAVTNSEVQFPNKRRKTDDMDIEDDLQKISEIVGGVNETG